jgi:hypothetical protein
MAAAPVTSKIGHSCNMLFLRYTAAAMFSLIRREPRMPFPVSIQNAVSQSQVLGRAYPNNSKKQPWNLRGIRFDTINSQEVYKRVQMLAKCHCRWSPAQHRLSPRRQNRDKTEQTWNKTSLEVLNGSTYCSATAAMTEVTNPRHITSKSPPNASSSGEQS